MKQKSQTTRTAVGPMSYLMYCLMGCFILGLFMSPPAVSGETADQVLEKMLDAQGGRKALGAVKDRTLTGTMGLIPLNAEGSLTMYQKEPDMMRMEAKLMGMDVIQGTDGQTAWAVNPQTGQVMDMPPAMAVEFKRQALGITAVMNPKKYGITYALKGKETINGTDYLAVEQTHSDGKTSTYLLEPKTYLTRMIRTTAPDQTGAEVPSETRMSDFKKVGDLFLPHTMTIFRSGQEYMKLTITDAKFNTGLDISFFQKESLNNKK